MHQMQSFAMETWKTFCLCTLPWINGHETWVIKNKIPIKPKDSKTTQTTKPNKNWVIWAHEIFIFCSETLMGVTVITVIVVTNLFFEYLIFKIQFLIFLVLCFLYILCFFCTVFEYPDPDLTENSWSCIPVVNRKLWVERLLWERCWKGASCRVCCLAGNETDCFLSLMLLQCDVHRLFKMKSVFFSFQ